MTKSPRQEEIERAAESYATGNHKASFPDTYDQKAFIAGAAWADKNNVRARDVLRLEHRCQDLSKALEIAVEALEEIKSATTKNLKDGEYILAGGIPWYERLSIEALSKVKEILGE